MKLVSIPASLDAIQAGDLVCFEYMNAHNNRITRVGEFVQWNGPGARRLMLLWDYTLRGGVNYRSYSPEHMRGTCKVVQLDAATEPVRHFRNEFQKFLERRLDEPPNGE